MKRLARGRRRLGANLGLAHFQDPPVHRKLRAIIMRTFTPRSIAALEPRIAQLTHELLGAALSRGELDLVPTSRRHSLSR